MAASGIAVLPSLRMGVTSTGSHLTGAYFPVSSVFNSTSIPGLSYIRGREDILDGLGDLRTNTITLNDGYCVFSLRISQFTVTITATITANRDI